MRGDLMSFKTIAEKMARAQGVSKDKASAMLAGATRKNMEKHGVITKHGIPKNVYAKKEFKAKMPGMSVHPMVNCCQQSRKMTIPLAACFVIMALSMLTCHASHADTYTDNYGNIYSYERITDNTGNVYRNNQYAGYYERQSTTQDSMARIDRNIAEVKRRCVR